MVATIRAIMATSMARGTMAVPVSRSGLGEVVSARRTGVDPSTGDMVGGVDTGGTGAIAVVGGGSSSSKRG